MKKESKIILSIIVILLVVIASYLIGYKKAYNDYELFLNNNDNGVKYQSFYATITDIEETGLTIDDTALTVKGLDINDINFRGNFKFVITEATEIEWRYTKLDASELEIGDNISIIFTGNIQESEPAKIEDVLKIQLLDDEIKEEVKWDEITANGIDENIFLENLNKDDLKYIATELQTLVQEESEAERTNPEIVLAEGWVRVFNSERYKNVINMGSSAMKPLYWIIYKSENAGMYEYICATALSELYGFDSTNEDGTLTWSNSKDFLEQFNKKILEDNK